MYNAIEDIDQPERISDVSDRATVEEQAFTDEALLAHHKRMASAMPAPTEDGTCACGCGEDVDPRRLKLGLGLALECARRRELSTRR